MDVNSITRNQDYLNKVNDTKENLQQVSNNSKSEYASFIYNQQNVVINAKESNGDSQYSAKKEENKEITKEELDDAVKKLNKYLEEDKTHAEYEKHKDLGTLMIKIVDDETDKVIVELPPKNVLDMIASMCKQAGILDKKA